MKEMHVWQLSSAPQKHYSDKQITAAHTIGEALADADDRDTIHIWGDGDPNGPLRYKENIKLNNRGLRLIGHGFPIIDGGGSGRTITCLEDDDLLQTLWGLEVVNGATDEDGGTTGS